MFAKDRKHRIRRLCIAADHRAQDGCRWFKSNNPTHMALNSHLPDGITGMRASIVRCFPLFAAPSFSYCRTLSDPEFADLRVENAIIA